MQRSTALLRRLFGASSAWLMGGEVPNRAGRFLLLLLLAHEVGAESFGAWVIAVATGTILANAADAGLLMTATTEIAADRSRTRTYLSNLWTAAPLLSAASFGLLLAVSPLLVGGTSLYLLLMLGLAGTIENGAVLLLAPLRARERFAPEGIMRAGQGIVLLLGGGALVISTGGSATAVAPLFLAVALASLVFAAAMTVRAFGFVRPTLDVAFLRQQLAMSMPAFGTTIAFFLYFRIDAYMLAFMKGDEATGLYGAAYNFAFGAAFLPLLFGRAMLARFASTAAGALRQAYAHAARVTAGMAVVLTALLALATPAFVLLYGSDFAAARPAYLLLIAAQGLYFFSHLNQMVLFGQRRQRTAWLLTVFALGINVAANLVLIPPLGASGAALAMVISEGAVIGLQALLLRTVLAGTPTGTTAEGLPEQPEATAA